MNTDRSNVLSTLNYFEGQTISFRKCIKKNLNFTFFFSSHRQKESIAKCSAWEHLDYL